MEYMNLILRGLLTTLNSITSTSTMTPNSYLVTWSPGVAAHLKTKYCTLPVCILLGSISKMGRFLNIQGDLSHHLFNYIIFYPGHYELTSVRVRQSTSQLGTRFTRLTWTTGEAIGR